MQAPSPLVLAMMLIIVALAGTLICASAFQRLRRSRSTRPLIEGLLRRLPFQSLHSDEAAPPEARPSKYMKRFAGVSVVNGNAIIDRGHYEQLREFPHALVEVSEVGTNVDSADFSMTEMATTMNSAFSRSATRFGASRTLPPRSFEDSATWDPARFHSTGPRTNASQPATVVVVEPLEPSPNASAQAPLPLSESTPVSAAEVVALPATRERTVTLQQDPAHPLDAETLANVLYSLQSSPVQRAPPGTFGTCVITNISVDDVVAHCAAFHNDAHDNNNNNNPTVKAHDTDGLGHAATNAPHEADRTVDLLDEAMTPYAYIMQQKAKKAREDRRAVVVVAPSSTSGTSEPRSATSAVEVSSASSPPVESVEGGAESNATAALTRPAKRLVRREHHRHHVNNGGFIVCEEVAPDGGEKRTRRGEVALKGQRRVFQLKQDEALYGSSQYISRLPNDVEDV